MVETPINVMSYISPQLAYLFVRFRNATEVLVDNPYYCFINSNNTLFIVSQLNIFIIFTIDFIHKQFVPPHHINRIHDQTTMYFADILKMIPDNRVHFAHRQMKLELSRSQVELFYKNFLFVDALDYFFEGF